MTRLIAFCGALLLLAGCHHPFETEDHTPPSPPGNLRTATGDNFIDLFWSPSPDHDVEGYSVYVSDSYNGRYDYVGSTSQTSFTDQSAKNGSTYYYAVAAYDFDGNEGALSRDVAYDIPRPEGYNVILSDAGQSPATAGYDFSDYVIVADNDQYADIVFQTVGGVPQMFVNTDTDIQDMGPTGSILDIGTAPSSGWSSTHSVALAPGHTYVVWTWDDHYAKFRVSSVSTGRVAFDWAYQLQKSNPLMKRPVKAHR